MRFGSRSSSDGCAFTLIELLVVVAIVALLMAILLPSLGAGRAIARSAVCKSNLHQIHLANQMYAGENHDYYVPAAWDMEDGFGGRHRWHGVRESSGVHPDPNKNHFDPARGPLVQALGRQGQVKRCPEFVPFVHEGAMNAFEEGTGGYGYNDRGVGSRAYDPKAYGSADSPRYLWQRAMRVTEIERPGATVMFTDAAFVSGTGPFYLIEYSFAEAPFWVWQRWSPPYAVYEWGQPVPSIHFRHRGKANVVWVDGHADGRAFGFTKDQDRELFMQFQIGWFDPNSNELFDPR
ncbi:MAG: prepilin-type N-terminal cleavage/methylation domain-containing protein [Phycisphaerae bacterium]|nr:prepilin-type N-terminal cleavage/methylation domain-containing protein [Phycisphaerae bacterium]